MSLNEKIVFNFEEGEVLLIDKPLDWSSFNVVTKIRNSAKIKKIGHAGTLDPLASGLLILCTGKMTKKINEFQDMDKEYTGRMILGKTTPSFDCETEVDSEKDISWLEEKTVREAALKFIGTIMQIPPIFSAIKVDGERLYKKARRGEEVKILPREINISEFEITEINLPEIHFRVVCSKGTYIRSLVRDFGISLETGAYMCALRRTRIGKFHVNNAYDLEDLVPLIKKKKMKVYRSLEGFPRLDNAVVTSGFFDGVHKGHQTILSRLVEATKASQGESVVITFWPHPRKVLHPEQSELKTLTTLEEKISLIASNHIDHLIVIPFTKEFSLLSSDEFVKNILLNRIGTKKLVIGYDHKFGKNREGSFEYLKNHAAEFGFEVEEIPRQDVDNTGVSSTLIRQALLEGNVKSAANYLGRNYSVRGTVVKGKQLGSSLGYPTANIRVDDLNKLIPKDGIYAVRVTHKGLLYKGMLSIGFNPTVNGTEKTIEVNIFEFNKNIYNDKLEILFVDYLREEEKFDNLEMLIEQLKKDKINSLAILK